MPLCVLCLSLVAYGRALTAPTPGLTLLMPPGVPDLCYAGTPTPAVIWSRCQIPPLHPPTSSPLSKQHSGVIFCLHKLLSAFHVATPCYLWIPLIWLHHSSSHQQLTAHICCGCLPHSCRSFTSLTLIVEFCGHPPIPVRPFSHHFVCVFTSPSHHVRQTTAAAIACLPSWTAWPCFQFPQGRLPRR